MTKIRERQTLFSLIIDFSFLPQVIWAVTLFVFVKGESAVLLSNSLAKAILAVFAEIAALALLSVTKRFYFIRYMQIGAYIQLVLTALIFGYRRAYVRFFAFGVCGIIIVFVNILSLYGYKKTKKLSMKENNYE